MNDIVKTDGKQSLVTRFADRFHVDPDKMIPALKSTVFRQKGGQEVSNEQMLMLLVVADQHKLNPFTKEIYAFPDGGGGVIPIVGVDGWARIINDHSDFDGMEFVESETKTTPEDGKECPEWIECVIYRKDRSHPIRVREYLDEVYRPPFEKNGRKIKGPWQTHTKRFLRHKAMIQCSRLAFSFSGIYDQDEAERIIEAEFVEEVKATDDIVMPESSEDDKQSEEENHA